MEFEQGLEAVDNTVFQKTGRRLGQVERLVLTGCWQNKTYDEISEAAGYSLSYINRTVAPKLWQTLSSVLEERVNKKNIRFCLERHWHNQRLAQTSSALPQANIPKPPLSPELWPSLSASSSPESSPSIDQMVDWGEAMDVSLFYGRQQEISILSQWIVQDRCRLVGILGLGGMGKTVLSIKLAQTVQDQFEAIIWRTVRNAPTLKNLLEDIIPLLSHQQQIQGDIGALLELFRQSRCLLILDNLETILDSRNAGRFRPDYEDYGELLRLGSETPHQSCILLTSRERPIEIGILASTEAKVRLWRLEGSWEIAQAILQAKNIDSSLAVQQQLSSRYSHCPLILKIVATSIQDLFAGDVAAFLEEDTLVFNGIRRLLDQQFQRLTPLELSVMYWLAIGREGLGLDVLLGLILTPLPKRKLLETLEALTNRCLIEKQANGYTQQPVVMEYVTDVLVEQVTAELLTGELNLFLSHALLQASSKDYIRSTQIRLILQPIGINLQSQFPTAVSLHQHMHHILQQIRDTGPGASYGAGNLLNLMQTLELDLTGADFSGLTIAQADLQNARLHRVNFHQASFSYVLFAESFNSPYVSALSPDNRYLAMTGPDGLVHMWDVTTGQRQLTLAAHQGLALGVAFSPTSEVLATASFDRTLKFWQIPTGVCLQVISTPAPIWSGCYSIDGQLFFLGLEDGRIQVWDVNHNQGVQEFSAHEATVASLAIHPQGTVLASSGYDRCIKLWHLPSRTCLYQLTAHSDNVWKVAFSPDGTVLATAGFDGVARLWDAAGLDTIPDSPNLDSSQILPLPCRHTLSLHRGQLLGLSFSPDGSLVATAGQDSLIRLWQVSTGQPVATLAGHRDLIWSVVFSQDGQSLYSVSNNEIKFWSVAARLCERTLYGLSVTCRTLAIHPAGTRLITGSNDRQIRLWDLISGHSPRILSGHTGPIICLTLCGDGSTLASIDDEGILKLWDLETGICRHTCKTGLVALYVSGSHHSDFPFIAISSTAKVIQLWNYRTAELFRTLEIPKSLGHPHVVTIHPHQPLIATGHHTGQLYLWHLTADQPHQTLSGQANKPWTIAFHPDQPLIASGGDDCTVSVWNYQTNTALLTLVGHTAAVAWVAFNSDGRLVASGAGDNTVRIWDVTTGQCLHTLTDHQAKVTAVAFSPRPLPGYDCPNLLISSSFDETIRLWDADTGTCLKILRPDRIYEGMNLVNASGLTEAEKLTLQTLGAIIS
ncbi:NB-ARC domain-containing protein [Synechococcus sp. PCC 6312]|uniref:WD40 domain-containing protein n=1 Tax=Synechococcus sp. (strain ATCC 27167 / PCC 6312) TaxID=195253 RepID=UPI00029ECA3F|nr:NB-ARC domain-containing protein [Synechococcus sp. PCC 6312]AFY62724.1 WD40 repeat-containing protein [Synechococcus sp. PCC 6312]